MKKSILLVTLLATSSLLHAESIEVPAMEKEKLSGRCQYGALPGAGAGSMKFVDASLPQDEIRVGSTESDGVGLGYLIGFELTPETVNNLVMASKVELVVNVVKTALGGNPSPLQVVLLSSNSPATLEMYPQFGAWNDAPQLTNVGTIESDPEIGEVTFDVTDAILKGAPATAEKPIVYFAIYAPMDDLVKDNRGKHVIFGGMLDEAPRLVISED